MVAATLPDIAGKWPGVNVMISGNQGIRETAARDPPEICGLFSN
jgi:hypothetical protein